MSPQPPEPAEVETLDQLAGYLRKLRSWARQPSYATLTARINARRGWDAAARKTTVYDCFRPGRSRVDADLILEIAGALGLDSARLNRLEQSLIAMIDRTEAAAVAEVRASVPAPSARFTGRARELADAAGRLEAAARTGDPPVVAITGPAGVGKTELALALADRVRRSGRHGELALFVDLRGFDPGRPPCAPAAVLAGLLRQLGVRDEQMYCRQTVDLRAELLRDTLVGRPAIMVLDNAADLEQVQRLLPGSPDCVVLVTSRRRLEGLARGQTVSLAALDRADALQLLRRFDRCGRVDAEPAAAVRLAEQLCFGMPLDLVALGARLADPHEESWSLADHVARLERFSPDEISRPALAGSYHALPAPAQRVFRLLAAHPGSDFTGYDVAALADVGVAEAEEAVNHLAGCHLLLQRRPGRFQLHDAVRAYARRLLDSHDPASGQSAAIARLFHCHRYLASMAMDHYAPGGTKPRRTVGQPTTPTPTIRDAAEALAWLDAERANLLAGARLAAEQGLLAHTSYLSATLARYLDAAGHWHDAEVLHRAASRITDPAGKGRALTSLAGVCWRVGRYHEAIRLCRRALSISRADRSSEIRIFNTLGLACLRLGRHREALQHHRRSLDLAREADDHYFEGTALNNLGVVYERMGRHDDALDHYRQVLDLFRELGNRVREAAALNNLGEAYRLTGRHDMGLRCGRQALALHRELGNRHGERCALGNLGRAYQARGRYHTALGLLHRAAALAHDLGDSDGECEDLNDAGTCLRLLGRRAEAIDHHSNAGTIAAASGNRYQLSRALSGIAEVLAANGDAANAVAEWQRALAIYRELRVPEADEVSARLAATAAWLSPAPGNPTGPSPPRWPWPSSTEHREPSEPPSLPR